MTEAGWQYQRTQNALCYTHEIIYESFCAWWFLSLYIKFGCFHILISIRSDFSIGFSIYEFSACRRLTVDGQNMQSIIGCCRKRKRQTAISGCILQTATRIFPNKNIKVNRNIETEWSWRLNICQYRCRKPMIRGKERSWNRLHWNGFAITHENVERMLPDKHRALSHIIHFLHVTSSFNYLNR